jgi:hypothetical protein
MLPRGGVALLAVAVLAGVSACTDDSSTAGRGLSVPTTVRDTVAQAPPTATSVPTSTTAPVARAPQDSFIVHDDYPDGYVYDPHAVPKDTPCQWFTVSEFNSIIDRAQAKAGTDLTVAYFDSDSDCVTQVVPSSDLEEVLTAWMRAGRWSPDRGALGPFSVSLVVDDGPRSPGWDRDVSFDHQMLDDTMPYTVFGVPSGDGPVDLHAELWLDDGPRLQLTTGDLDGPAATGALSDPEVAQKWTDLDSFDWFDPELRPITEPYEAFVLALANEIAIEMGRHGEAT